MYSSFYPPTHLKGNQKLINNLPRKLSAMRALFSMLKRLEPFRAILCQKKMSATAMMYNLEWRWKLLTGNY
jgi:hypothetical protein